MPRTPQRLYGIVSFVFVDVFKQRVSELLSFNCLRELLMFLHEVNNPDADVATSSLDNLILNALCDDSGASEFLKNFTPAANKIELLINKLKRSEFDREELLFTMEMVAKLVDLYEPNEEEIVLAFLSLPWIPDLSWESWSRFQKMMPLLAEVKKVERSLKEIFGKDRF